MAYIMSTEDSSTVDGYIDNEDETLPTPIDHVFNYANYTDAVVAEAVEQLESEIKKSIDTATVRLDEKFVKIKKNLDAGLEEIRITAKNTVEDKMAGIELDVDQLAKTVTEQIEDLKIRLRGDQADNGTCGCGTGDIDKMAMIIKAYIDNPNTRRRKRAVKPALPEEITTYVPLPMMDDENGVGGHGNRYQQNNESDKAKRKRKKRSTEMSNTRPHMNPTERGKAKILYYAYNTQMDFSEISHSIESMLLDCSFQGVNCSHLNFTSWDHGSFGRCHTMVPDKRFHSFSGPKFGLSMTLNVELAQYIPLISTSTGFQVLIHPSVYVPFPEDAGFVVSPGQSTLIGLKWKTIRRLPLPYDDTDCGTEEDLGSRTNAFMSWMDRAKLSGLDRMNYTFPSCAKSCYVFKVLDECKCIDASVLPYSDTFFYSKIANISLPKACDITQVDDWNCMTNVTKNIVEERSCVKQCPQPCDETEYVKTITGSTWPRVDGIVWEKYRAMRDFFPPDLQKHLVKLNVFFQELNYESVVQMPAMLFYDLLSDIGGTFGLFIGASFMTCLEFGHLIIECLRNRKDLDQVDAIPAKNIRPE